MRRIVSGAPHLAHNATYHARRLNEPSFPPPGQVFQFSPRGRKTWPSFPLFWTGRKTSPKKGGVFPVFAPHKKWFSTKKGVFPFFSGKNPPHFSSHKKWPYQVFTRFFSLITGVSFLRPFWAKYNGTGVRKPFLAEVVFSHESV